MRRLKEASHDARTLGAINSVEVFPKGRTTIDDTWFPSIYFGLRLDRPESAFFYINEALSYDATKLMLVEGQKVTECFAAYTFLFPQRYAPLSYFWGMSVQPAGRDAGKWGRTESRRLSNWRDNTDIGISSNGSRNVYSVSDGYIRDIYPLMLISSEHLKRKVGRVSLAEAVATEKMGSLTPEGDMFLWRLDIEEQGPARRLLEKYDISLSGHRITPLSS